MGRKIFPLNPPDTKWSQNFNGILSAGKEKRFTIHTECLHSQGPKDQSKACLPRAVSPVRGNFLGENLTCVPWHLGAFLNAKNHAHFFPGDFEVGALAGWNKESGIKRDHAPENLRRRWRNSLTHSRFPNLSEGEEEDFHVWLNGKGYREERRKPKPWGTRQLLLKGVGMWTKGRLNKDMRAPCVGAHSHVVDPGEAKQP